ncbi:MAG: hypothetical protein QOH87_3338 [Trebonia sp.]|jgi:hypothetical protein|nr:hypothetical protein [Trebonia sp.]
MMWAAARANRIKRLRAAHEAFGGTGPGRRWVTDELNHALILRLASEFQGFARDLHDETGAFVARCLAPGNQQLQDSRAAHCHLSRGGRGTGGVTLLTLTGPRLAEVAVRHGCLALA